ncbi:MAG: N-acetylglucosaminyl-diphospho-decaprenol L-rhamnosyltransferase [Syntrophus sp. SKADARSKE-3]|nr:N-acetylglucosaminyl-diphospho-decaprenol L-rhamnosyltransferase [Syntrophus sp. SKADARSKE-3]
MDISVIIVNWNTRDLLKDCLSSVFRTLTNAAFEVIVVDNGSSDGSVEMVRESFPSVRLIANADNRGFGAANNQALRVMNGRYALLLNSDTVITDQAALRLFSFMETHPEVAMACGQLLNRDGSKQHSFASFPNLITITTNTPLLEWLFPRRYPSKRYDYAEPREVDSPIGACLMVRKVAMDQVGIFDERYFFFFEETDWAFAMRRAGWMVYYVPGVFIYHFQGQSIGANVQSRIEFYRSRYQYFKKWKSRPYCVLVMMIIIVRLTCNWFFTGIAAAATLGLNKALRDKWVVYSRLLLWHLVR